MDNQKQVILNYLEQAYLESKKKKKKMMLNYSVDYLGQLLLLVTII